MGNIYFSVNKKSANSLSAAVKSGKLKRIYRGIYTPDLDIPDSEIIRTNWMKVAAYIVPDGILCCRTALDCRPYPYKDNNSVVFMVGGYGRSIQLPGLILKIYEGDNSNFVERIHPDLLRTDQPRTFLENLSATRSLRGIKTVSREEIEIQLARILHNRGEVALNDLRDKAREISEKLDLKKEFSILNSIISALLSTHTDNNSLTSGYAKAILRKEPFDTNRIKLFADLSTYLQRCDFVARKYNYDRTSFKNLSFFEAYFSNYIEGTKFIIDEAEEIVFSGKIINNRHQDSHDVLSNFMISNDFFEISKTPNSAKELIELLQYRHSILMGQRPEVGPGQFKAKDNKAGNTYFVKNKDVVGTLMQAFDIYAALNEGMHRALFIHFVVSEIHPFNDGNGRISRIMLNSELVKNQDYKIIIPNVYRESYMNALRSVTRDSYFLAYCRMMDIAQAYTASVPWFDYGYARDTLEKNHADQQEDEGLPFFNRVLQKLWLTEFPV
jgi:Fic family protein